WAYPVSVTKIGNGTVSSDPSGIDCGAVCSATIDPIASPTVTLSAQPSPGQVFVGWSGACTGATSTCLIAFGGATAAIATFADNGASLDGGVPGDADAGVPGDANADADADADANA